MEHALASAAIGLLYIGYTVIRLRAERAAAGRIAQRDAVSRRDRFLLSVLTAAEAAILLLYFLRFSALELAAIGLSPALRAAGLALGAAGLYIVDRAGAALDGEYSPVVELSEGHVLVTSGPYRYVRHPLYAGFLLFHAGVALISANAFIAAVWICGLMGLIGWRLPREEKALERRFGGAWVDYRARTPAFLPRLPRFHRSPKAPLKPERRPRRSPARG
jgi:protein-S-isoprenylcysteine O-methyltransferase Ste14